MPEPTGPQPSALTYCVIDGWELHRAWAPFGDGWLTSCDDPETALSLPPDVSPDSPALVPCRYCFPTQPTIAGARRHPEIEQPVSGRQDEQ